jgi:glycosyltransferase involved in cell wall biosynthesis
MQRICSSLAGAGYKVTLVGRKLSNSIALTPQSYHQKRLNSKFTKGKLMYLEFNLRLFFHLLLNPADCICAIDLDTILPCYFVSKFRNKKRVYDAHELFTEQKEIITRPSIQKLWLKVEKYAVPKFKSGYTVNVFIAEELKRRYKVDYAIVRNLPKFIEIFPAPNKEDPFIIYQGAVNEGRSFETLIPAMKYINARLIICGNGNFFTTVQCLITKHHVQHKVELRGYVLPEELRQLTPTASIAIMLFENTGLNQYYSLANRFFDYIMAGVPQVCVAYPEYESINKKYGVAYLIENTEVSTIAAAVNNLLANDVLYKNIQQNCLRAREELNWSTEEKLLIEVYKNIFS